MLNEQVSDEITSLNAIYGPDTLVASADSQSICILTIPNETSISLRISFPSTYPDEIPLITGVHSIGSSTNKNAGSSTLDLSRSILKEVFSPGSACIYDLIEVLLSRLSSSPPFPPVIESEQLSSNDFSINQYAVPNWSVSSTVTVAKSTFLAHCCAVESLEHAQWCISHLLSNDKKLTKATHNMTVYRIKTHAGSGEVMEYQDYNDDGESAAGGRLLRLLQSMEVWNVLVVVSRWFGGIKLGAERFKWINSVARESVVNAGLTPHNENEKAKK